MEERTDNSPDTAFTWRACPAAERRGPALLAVIVILIMAALVYVLLRYGGTNTGISSTVSILCSLAAAAFLFLTLHRFFFPSRYTIDENGITCHHLFSDRHYRWEEIHQFRHDENGGYLMATPYRPRLAPMRGLHLLFNDHREEVIRRIRLFLDRGEKA